MEVLKDDEEELVGSKTTRGNRNGTASKRSRAPQVHKLSERVDTILDKENFTMEELLDEDEIIQQCKAYNYRLLNFLRARTQVEQLVRYIVEEPAEDAEKGRTFKFPFIACEIFTCEDECVLKALVKDEELMNMLFSFLEPEHPHNTLLAGYFSKVVIRLQLRETVSLRNYIQAHQDIIKRLVDLIGIRSIMEALIYLIGADGRHGTCYLDLMQWLEDTDVLEMIVDKLSSTDCPEVHANAAEALCGVARHAIPGLATKISSLSFIARLFRHALEDSRPKSVLVHSLSVCISLLDPKRQTLGTYYSNNRESPAKPETVEAMLESLGSLLKLLDVSAEESVLFTTFGKLQPPLGKNRLKIIEFISVLTTVGSEAAEKELIRLGALIRILDLFFEYPYNNLAHHHIEHMIVSCLESKNISLIQHIIEDCHLVRKILDAEKNCALNADPKNVMLQPTLPAQGRTSPRIGNVGHMTRIANKLIEQGANNTYIESYLQGDSEWAKWHTDVLTKRNALENVDQWECGRPTEFRDRGGRDVEYDNYLAAIIKNLGLLCNNDEAHGSLDRDDEVCLSTSAVASTTGGNGGGEVTSKDLVDSATSECADDTAIRKSRDELTQSEIEWRESAQPETSVMTTESAATDGNVEVTSTADDGLKKGMLEETQQSTNASLLGVVC